MAIERITTEEAFTTTGMNFEAMGFSEADKKKLYQTNSERVFKL